MRRLLVSLSALGLLGAIVGCHHTAGCCDCDIPGHQCPGCCGPSAPSGIPMQPALKAEPLKEMPKENDKKEEKKEEKAPEVMGDGPPN